MIERIQISIVKFTETEIDMCIKVNKTGSLKCETEIDMCINFLAGFQTSFNWEVDPFKCMPVRVWNGRLASVPVVWLKRVAWLKSCGWAPAI